MVYSSVGNTVEKSDSADLARLEEGGGETGGRESEGRSDQVKFFKLFRNGRIGSSCMTDSNFVELFNEEFFLAEKKTSKVKIPLF